MAETGLPKLLQDNLICYWKVISSRCADKWVLKTPDKQYNHPKELLVGRFKSPCYRCFGKDTECIDFKLYKIKEEDKPYLNKRS